MYVIAWETNKACFEYQQYSSSMMNFDELSGYEVEIVGNKFDNPELLDQANSIQQDSKKDYPAIFIFLS